MSIGVSIIIVSYNTKELTQNCIQSVFEQTKDIDFEVIVSDNGSSDGSIEMIKKNFPHVMLIENKANIGFGAANNRALRIAKGKYIFYLNSDTILLNNAVKIFFDYWENSAEKEKLGALGCVLFDAELHPIHSGGKFPTYTSLCQEQLIGLFLHSVKSVFKFFGLRKFYKTVSNKKRRRNLQFDKIEYITGADLFLKNDENALFDEDFFLYYEETDLELRLAKENLARKIITEPKIIHLTKKEDRDFSVSNFSTVCSQISAIKYAQKNLRTRAYFLRFLTKLDHLNPYNYRLYKKVLGVYKR